VLFEMGLWGLCSSSKRKLVVLTGPSTLERSGRFDLLRSWLNTGMELRLGLLVCGQLTCSYCILLDRCGMWHVAVGERSGRDEEELSCVMVVAIDTCRINGKIVAIVTCKVTRLL